ncbi:MAG: hypothetical protein WDN31_09680 [Hyphomicrobium sp.]
MLLAAPVLCSAAYAQESTGNGYGPYSGGRTGGDDAYRPPASDAGPAESGGSAYQPPYRPGGAYREDDNYRRYEGDRAAAAPQNEAAPGYGEPYHAPGEPYDDRAGPAHRPAAMVTLRTRSFRPGGPGSSAR